MKRSLNEKDDAKEKDEAKEKDVSDSGDDVPLPPLKKRKPDDAPSSSEEVRLIDGGRLSLYLLYFNRTMKERRKIPLS
jgi:hypothetical protein